MKSSKNIENILIRRSFPDFIKALNNKVDVKEWSEVGGVFELVRRILKDFNPTFIYDIGCGKRPTLALLMALNYKADVTAIDPQLEKTENLEKIQRLCLKPYTLEEAIPELSLLDNALILANHSHAPKTSIRQLLQKCKNWVYVTVPCCVDNKLYNKAAVTFKDIHSHSPKNDFYVYASNKEFLTNLL